MIPPGLHIIKDLSKIQENCANLNIDISGKPSKQEFYSKVKVTILGQVCVVTILVSGNKQSQFLIQKDLDLNNLKWLASKKLNGHYQDAIKRAYETLALFNFQKLLGKT